MDNASDKALVDGFRGIADLADRLGLVATVRDQAKETFKKLDDAKACPRGHRNRDAVYAACLYIACRNLGMPRTYKELASVTADGDKGNTLAGRRRSSSSSWLLISVFVLCSCGSSSAFHRAA